PARPGGRWSGQACAGGASSRRGAPRCPARRAARRPRTRRGPLPPRSRARPHLWARGAALPPLASLGLALGASLGLALGSSLALRSSLVLAPSWAVETAASACPAGEVPFTAVPSPSPPSSSSSSRL